MIVAQYSKEEADLEPQAMALGLEPQHVLAALGVRSCVDQLPDLLLTTERAAHSGTWSLTWAEAVEHGIDTWCQWRDRFLSAGLGQVRRTGSPRENLRRFNRAVGAEVNLPADSTLTALLTVCLIRREEIDTWLTRYRTTLH